MKPLKIFSESHTHSARFERALLWTWSLTMLAYVLWILIYTVQEFRPAI